MTQTVRLTTFSRPSPLLAAQHRGFLEEEGLVVEVEDARGSRPQIEGLLAGRWDLAHTNADNVMRFRATGVHDLAIFLVADLGIAQKLIVHPDVRTFDDLRGRSVGVDAPDSGYAFVVYELLARAGLTRDDYEVVPLGATAYRLSGLRDGRIQAGLLSHHHETAALDDGFVILADTRDGFPTHAGITAASTRRYSAAHPEVVRGYARALLRATAWTVDPANAEDVVRVVAEGRGVSLDQARRLLAVEVGGRTGVIRSVADAAASLSGSADLREQYTGVRPQGYFDPGPMSEALTSQSAPSPGRS